MLQVTCVDVDARMPEPLRLRMGALMREMYGEYIVVTCDYVATEHVKEAQTARSWPPEFWVHMRSRVHEPS